MSAAPKRIAASTMVALAIACAVASCQRSTEGAACPCLAGYQCCATKQACYPENVRCPGTEPGALAWTASGIPTFDQVGNVFLDEDKGFQMHDISLLDRGNGVPRWTEHGDLRLVCSTDEIAVFEELAGPRKLFGVAIADGSRRWEVSLYGEAYCPGTGTYLYVTGLTPPGGFAALNVYATRDGAITWSVPLDHAPIDPPIWVAGVQDHLALLWWSNGTESTIQAVELPGGQPGSVSWTAHLPYVTSLAFQARDRIYALTRDPTLGESLVWLAPADGQVIWRHTAAGGAATWVGSRWSGTLLLKEADELVAIARDNLEVLWTFPLTEPGHGDARLRILDSGEPLISHDILSQPGTTLNKLVGSNGQVRWTFNQKGSFYAMGPDESYLLAEGYLVQFKLESNDRGWEYLDDYNNYLRAIHGYDDARLFVRAGSHSDGECASAPTCSQRFVAFGRLDGSLLWRTDWLVTSPSQDFFVHSGGDRVYVFAPAVGAVRTGVLWAFWQ
jgi:outer membrane protein assembly factor BamB